ncbi:Protein 21.1 [Giardia lamblia P15]|uniref:Protein 21.1 n=1 Tax=Giardia intestinalis (strain P15) TaxID=658858 RepID=E1F4Y5_GIAIA|nr:Protein 21.1 [Giardia lamblia P15]
MAHQHLATSNTTPLYYNFVTAMLGQDTDLLSAVQQRDILNVIRLCPRYWGTRNDAGLTALHLAVRNSFLLGVRVLRTYEARLRLPNGRTALMEATMQRSIRSILLLRRFEKRCQDRSGKTALMFAAGMGYYRAVHILAPLESGLRDTHGLTALMHATLANSVSCVRALLRHEAKQVDLQGRSALIYAVLYGCSTVIPLLLKLEAGLQDNKGNTAFIYACRLNSVWMLSQLYPYERTVVNKRRQTGLMNAAMTHSIDAVSFLIAKERSYLSFSSQSDLPKPLKHSHSRNGNIFRICIGHLILRFNHSPICSVAITSVLEFCMRLALVLSWRLQDLKEEVVRYFPMVYLTVVSLLRVYLLPIYVHVCRFFALLRRDIKFLFTNRVDIRLESSELYSPVTTSTRTNFYTRGKRHLKYSVGTRRDIAQLGSQDAYGFTALIYACKVKNLHIVKALVPYEAGIQTVNGEYALSIALRNVDEVPSVLIDAESHLCDDNLKRPCEIAFEAGHVALGKALVEQIVDPCMTNIAHRSRIRMAFLRIEGIFETVVSTPSYLDWAEDVLELKESIYNAIFDSISPIDHDINLCLDVLELFASENTCVVCYDRPVSMISIPCRHFILCSECSTKLTKCPVCMVLTGSYVSI